MSVMLVDGAIGCCSSCWFCNWCQIGRRSHGCRDFGDNVFWVLFGGAIVSHCILLLVVSKDNLGFNRLYMVPWMSCFRQQRDSFGGYNCQIPTDDTPFVVQINKVTVILLSAIEISLFDCRLGLKYQM